MAGLLNYNFNTRYAPSPIVGSAEGRVMEQAGKTIVADDLKNKLQEKINQWKVEAEGRQNTRQDARFEVTDARNQTKDKADVEHRKAILEGNQADREATADYRTEQGLLQRDEFNEKKRQSTISNAQDARDRATGYGKGKPDRWEETERLKSARKEIEGFNEILENSGSLNELQKKRYANALKIIDSNGTWDPLAQEKPAAPPTAKPQFSLSAAQAERERRNAAKQNGNMQKEEQPLLKPQPTQNKQVSKMYSPEIYAKINKMKDPWYWTKEDMIFAREVLAAPKGTYDDKVISNAKNALKNEYKTK